MNDERVPCYKCGKWTVDGKGRWQCNAPDCPNEEPWPVLPWVLYAIVVGILWLVILYAVFAE